MLLEYSELIIARIVQIIQAEEYKATAHKQVLGGLVRPALESSGKVNQILALLEPAKQVGGYKATVQTLGLGGLVITEAALSAKATRAAAWLQPALMAKDCQHLVTMT